MAYANAISWNLAFAVSLSGSDALSAEVGLVCTGKWSLEDKTDLDGALEQPCDRHF
jgi:hypothetical protein